MQTGAAPPALGFFAALRLGARMMWRDARAGELRLLVLALVIAVAAVTSVGFLADRVGRALERDAGQMLGADVVLDADAPIAPAVSAEAGQRGLQVTTTLQFPSMAGFGDAAQLASIKAVQPGYPLRGNLRVAPGPQAPDAVTREIPAAGEVWVDGQLLVLLQAKMGDRLTLGDAHLRIARVLTYEPDRGMQFVNVAPRVMMNAQDIPASGLVAPGSRIGYALLAAGAPEAVAGYTAWLNQTMQRGQKLATLDSGRPEVRRALDRAQRFLSLVALLSVLISAVAVALAARRFMLRHRDGIAVMRCLGAVQRSLAQMLTAEFALVGLGASLLGCLLGLGVHYALVAALGQLIDTDLPAPAFTPALQGTLTGVWLLLGFAMPSLAQLKNVPPARVFRRDIDQFERSSLIGYLIGAAGFALLIWWFAGDAALGAVVAGGFLGAFAVFALLAWLCILGLARLRRRAEGWPALRFALAGIVRRRAATITQVCALAIGIMALLLLTMTRTDLIGGWQRTLPPDAPNRFLINIQPDQRGPVTRQLSSEGITAAPLAPMVRGRLVSIGDRQIQASDYDNQRAQRLVEREFNLSYGDSLPDHNRIQSGRPLDPAASEVSMETGISETLGIKLGDKLGFDVAGKIIEVKVTSLRSVDWDSMRVNFFAILSPATLANAPQSWITSFHLPPDKLQALTRIVQAFPNLTVFDIGSILAQLQSVLDQVIQAVQMLFLFTLAAGVLVLAAALTATRDERVRESAVMRALGATRAQLARAQRIELLATGGLAGLLAAAGAQAIGLALSRGVFDFEIQMHLWPWGLGLAIGMLGAWGGGALALRGVLRTPPLLILREA
jgi:putative ABC transport system permease protein